ncbi:MAG: NAD-dependent protein deacylase [Planctomycetes bacterium]|jgi:NAD-dependent deacetylase|nr:NAD-dependent protein deacylase [Planctomycetota bacterium]
MGDFALPEALLVALRDVRSVGVITGAGISAESGIPTYRGKGGIYDDPDEGDRTVEALSAPTLQSDPDRTWRALFQIAGAAVNARPNAGHTAIVEIERKAERFVLLTQNVDGLHRLAGSRNIIDIHGDAFELICMSCGKQNQFNDPRTGATTGQGLDIHRCAAAGRAPRCPCGGVYRPEVVLFGEMLPEDKLRRLYAELLDNPPDLVISVGTSAMFPYIVQPMLVARMAGKLTIEINPEPTEISDFVAFHLKAKAGDALPAIAAALPNRV